MNILLIFLGFLILLFIIIFIIQSIKIRNLSIKSKNNVHFYIARDMDGKLWLYLGKPIRVESEFNITEDRKVTVLSSNLKRFGLNEDDYTDLKWENEPVEVFLNLED